MSDSQNIVWAIKTRYLDYNNKWHTKQTKWYTNSTEAWEEAERLENTLRYYEISENIIHKQR